MPHGGPPKDGSRLLRLGWARAKRATLISPSPAGGGRTASIIVCSSFQHPDACRVHDVDQPTGKTPQRHAGFLVRRDFLCDPCLHAEVGGGTSKAYGGHG